MFGRQHGRWQSLHAQLSQCRACRRLLFLDVFIGCLLFLGRAKDPYPLLLGLQEMLMLTPVFGGGSFCGEDINFATTALQHHPST